MNTSELLPDHVTMVTQAPPSVVGIANIEDSKLACDTGGHFTNYPTWPLPRTNPNVDVLNNS